MTLLTLSDDQIDIWLVQPSKVTEPELLARYFSLISSAEHVRVKRYIREKDQHSALITRSFIRCVLSHYADLTPNDWQFGVGFNGKPFVENAGITLEFNLSHANDLIVCSVTKRFALGIDVEYIKRSSDTYKLAPRYFAANEVAALNQFPYEQQPSRFYDFWTLKESYIKACGDGLAIPLDHFGFEIGNRENIRLTFSSQRDDCPDKWQSWLFDASCDHRLALTVKADVGQPIHLTTRYLIPLSSPDLVSLPLF